MQEDYSVPITPFTFATRASSTTWQSQLRRSVRLYLALGDEPINAQELEAHLQRTEDELVQYLLQGEPSSPASIQQAQHVLDMAQNALLGSEPDVQLLLRELSPEQALLPASITTEPDPSPPQA